MTERLPSSAEVVIIGGGVIGCSTAYHLAKNTSKEVILLEKDTITSGTTWHAAGAVGQLRNSANITRLLGHSVALYESLEKETGQSTGWVRNGSIRLACNNDRKREFERAATIAHSFGLEFDIISPREAQEMIPQMEVQDVLCAAYVGSDGVASPSDLTTALAKGARMHGAQFHEGVTVTGFDFVGDRIRAVRTSTDEVIECDVVVNCAGIWSRQLGRMAGVNIPVQPSYHQYFISEIVDGLARNVPTVRDPDNLTYFKEEVGGLAVGGYELNPVAWDEAAVPESFSFQLFPEVYERFEPFMSGVLARFPALESVGIKQWFNGLESFTEDGMFVLGKAPERDNFFVGTGFNAFGIASAGGAGKALSEWITEGAPEFDLWSADIRRFGRYTRDNQQLRLRALEGQARHYTMSWPDHEHEACRPLRRSPLYERLRDKGACFGAKFGWERANWFAPDGVEPKDVPSFGEPNWMPHSAEEHKACREQAILIDQSSFAKYVLVGKDAQQVLTRACPCRPDFKPFSTKYTQILNEDGGIACDLTLTRISDNEFYIVTGTGFAIHDFEEIRSRIRPDQDAHLIDITSAYAVLVVMGPSSRGLLSSVAQGDFAKEAFPFGACREVMIAGAPVRAMRVSFVGELGWELHVPSEYATSVYDALFDQSEEWGLRDAGYRSLDSLRLEKGNRLWGVELSPDYNPFEAGLGGFVAISANQDFIGRDALIRQKSNPLARRLVCLTHDEPSARLLGGETILRNGERVGWLSSGGYGHSVGQNIGLGYVRNEHGVDDQYLEAGKYELEVRNQIVPARLHLQALYDPDNLKLRS